MPSTDQALRHERNLMRPRRYWIIRMSAALMALTAVAAVWLQHGAADVVREPSTPSTPSTQDASSPTMSGPVFGVWQALRGSKRFRITSFRDSEAHRCGVTDQSLVSPFKQRLGQLDVVVQPEGPGGDPADALQVSALVQYDASDRPRHAAVLVTVDVWRTIDQLGPDLAMYPVRIYGEEAMYACGATRAEVRAAVSKGTQWVLSRFLEVYQTANPKAGAKKPAGG